MTEPENKDVILSRRHRLRAAGRVLVAVLLGLLVLNFIPLMVMNPQILPDAMRTQPFTEGFLNHTPMWLVSLVLILIISKGRLAAYGFRVGKNYRIKQIIALGGATGVAFALILKLFPEAEAFQRDYTFLQTVVFVWLYASVSEEILTRGLIQGFLAPLARYGFSVFRVRISLPVLVSALFFGLMHLVVLTTGVAVLPVIGYVVFASVLGFIAGYQREKTGSLIPAIMVHMFGNIGGYGTGLLVGW